MNYAELTDDELRLEVARRCGYRWYGVDKEAWLAMPGRTGLLPRGVVEIDNPSDGDELHIKSPNYPRDIAAAYALEDALPEEKCALYVYNLLLVYTSSNNENNIRLGLIHASAADRCRAWLWTMEG